MAVVTPERDAGAPDPEVLFSDVEDVPQEEAVCDGGAAEEGEEEDQDLLAGARRACSLSPAPSLSNGFSGGGPRPRHPRLRVAVSYPPRALAGAEDDSEDEVAGGGRRRKPIAGKEVSVKRARNVLRSRCGKRALE